MAYFTTSDNVNIYYEINGKGIPIIFIHGFSETNDVFRIQKRTLSKKYSVIAYDIRGHGESDKAGLDLSMKRLSLDLKELIRHLEYDRVVIVAWSMGATILLDYIRNFGTDKLYKICIVDKGPKMINDENWKLGLYHGDYKSQDFKSDLSMLIDNFPEFCKRFTQTMSTDLNEKEFKIGLEKISRNSNEVLHDLWKSMGENDYRDTIKKIDIETLIVFGENSNLYSVETGEYLRDNIKKSKLKVFPKCGHLLILENPREFNRIIEEFIEE